jgi:citrate lyase subunit beta / citryl-CoA lyase
LSPGAVDLIPIPETAPGLCQIEAMLAAGTRTKYAAFGAGDFTLDVNMIWSRGESELAQARAAIVTASRAAGIEPPLDTVWIDLADEAGLEASVRTALALGFQGKMCIHPNQIAIVNRVFTPSDDEVAFPERIAAAFAAVEASGSAAIRIDGKFIDYPIVYRAQQVLAQIAAIRRREGRQLADIRRDRSIKFSPLTAIPPRKSPACGRAASCAERSLSPRPVIMSPRRRQPKRDLRAPSARTIC